MTTRIIRLPEQDYEKLQLLIQAQQDGHWLVKAREKGVLVPRMEYRDIRRLEGEWDYETDLYVIPDRHKDSIPDREKYPHPLRMVSGEVYRHHVQVGDLRIPIEDSTNMIEEVNAALSDALRPEVVTELEVVEEPIPILRVSNDSVLVYASRAAWDRERGQLVAATLVSSSKMSLTAILSTLATNSRQTIRLRGVPDEETITLENAQRGFLGSPHRMEGGYAVTVYHPLSGDPRQSQSPYFYTVGAEERLMNRLKAALPWPVQDGWYEYLMETGKDVGLIAKLSVVGDFPPAYRVFTGANGEESGWEEVISAGISGGSLSLN